MVIGGSDDGNVSSGEGVRYYAIGGSSDEYAARAPSTAAWVANTRCAPHRLPGYSLLDDEDPRMRKKKKPEPEVSHARRRV